MEDRPAGIEGMVWSIYLVIDEMLEVQFVIFRQTGLSEPRRTSRVQKMTYNDLYYIDD